MPSNLTPDFLVVAAVTVLASLAALLLRNLIHCALCLSVAFVGFAALYLQLGAQFVGFAQILVYVGAVAILIVFAILLTRSAEQVSPTRWLARGWWLGLLVAAGVFAVFAAAIGKSTMVPIHPTDLAPPAVTVQAIGRQLLDNQGSRPESYILPLLVTGVLLTAALMGAMLLALKEETSPSTPQAPASFPPATPIP